MKKLIVVLLVILNVIIFFNVRDVFLQKDEVETLNGEVADFFYLISIENFNNESITLEESQLVFDFINELVANYDVTIYFSDIENNQLNRYVASANPIDEVFRLATDTSLIFGSDTTYFYTNQRNVENGIHFFLLNDHWEVNLLAMRRMEILNGGNYSFFSNDREELLHVVDLFITAFDHLVESSFEIELGEFEHQSYIDDFLGPLIVITQFFTFFIILFYIHLNAKKIAILKTLGHSPLSLFHYLFSPLILRVFLTVLLTQGLLFALFIRVINERTVPIVLSLFDAASSQIIGIFLTILMSSLLLLLVPLYALIKNKSFTRFLMTANFLIKILLLLVILPVFNTRLEAMVENFRYLQEVQNYRTNGYLGDFEFSPGWIMRYSIDGRFNTLMEIGEHGYEEIGPDIIYDYDIIYQHHSAFRLLNDAGAIMSESSVMFSGEAALNVNENFLQRHPIMGLDGNLVDLSHVTTDIVNLIPERYAGSAIVNELRNLGEEVIYVLDDQMVFDYTLGWGFWGLVDSSYIISVQMDFAFDLWASPFRILFYEGDINELLSDTVFYNRIQVSTINEELDEIGLRHWRQVRDHLFVLVPLVLMVMFISVQYAYLYMKVYLKRIASSILMGYNDFYTWRHLFIELTIGIVATMSMAWYLRIDFNLLLFVVFMDFIVYVAMICWSRYSPKFKLNGE